jgi:hypothetical protein
MEGFLKGGARDRDYIGDEKNGAFRRRFIVQPDSFLLIGFRAPLLWFPGAECLPRDVFLPGT